MPAAGGREQQAFGEKLLDHTEAAASHRKSNRDFFSTRGGARSQQAGEIRARDQKDQADHAH